MDTLRRWLHPMIASLLAALGLATTIDTTQPRSAAATRAAYFAVTHSTHYVPTPEPSPDPPDHSDDPSPGADSAGATSDRTPAACPSTDTPCDTEEAATLQRSLPRRRGLLRRLLRR